MKTYPYLDALEKKGEAKGKAEGKAEAKAEDVVVVLETRGLKVSAALRKKIRACTEIAQLDRLHRRAVLVKSTRELFE